MRHLTYASAAILDAVARGFRHGFEIMESTGLPSGTVYPALRRMEKTGLVRSDWEEDALARRAGRPRRRYYAITAGGKAALALARQRFRPLGEAQPAPEV